MAVWSLRIWGENAQPERSSKGREKWAALKVRKSGFLWTAQLLICVLLKCKGTVNNSLKLNFLNNLHNHHPGLQGRDLWLQCVWQKAKLLDRTSNVCSTEVLCSHCKIFHAWNDENWLSAMKPKSLIHCRPVVFFPSCFSLFKNVTYPCTVHLLTSSALSGFKKNRSQ